MICWRVRPKVRVTGSDSFITGLSSLLYWVIRSLRSFLSAMPESTMMVLMVRVSRAEVNPAFTTEFSTITDTHHLMLPLKLIIWNKKSVFKNISSLDVVAMSSSWLIRSHWPNDVSQMTEAWVSEDRWESEGQRGDERSTHSLSLAFQLNLLLRFYSSQFTEEL